MFYLDLFRALQREDVRYLVVGGLADDLIRLKEATGRQRDRSDIEALERARRLVDDGED